MRNRFSNRFLLAAGAALPALTMAQQTDRPNIMLIVVDDMGYSDLECFGGEVQSPNLTALAEEGSRYTQFFNCGRSCPSRASLLTGCYPHTVGITGMGLSMTTNCVTVAEALGAAGYHTAMSGKWHLSLTQSIGNDEQQMKWLSHQDTYDGHPFSALSTYPCNRGFDEHWGTIWGVTDHFDPFSLVHNEEPIFTDSIPSDFYYADFVADKAIDMIDDLAGKDDPFFMYVAFQEPHWPVQAKPEDIAKYKGVYDEGWDVLRERRYNNMVEMGLVDPATTPNAPNASGRIWENESNPEWQAANMECHAAMVDCVDQNIGRIMDELRAKGLYDNTLIMFSSDNGASSENYSIGSFDRHDRTRSGETVVHDAAVPGSQLTYNYLGTGWAGAVNTPFRYWKTQSFHGGTAAPTIIKWPESMHADKGNIVSQPCNFIDFMPTCLEVAGVEYPTTYKGHKIQALPAEGRSLVPMAKDGAEWDTERTMYWEHENGKAIRTADWRLTAHTSGGWQLFNMHTDYSETNNVAAEYPEVVKELRTKWNTWAKSVGLSVTEVLDDTPKSLVFHYTFDENIDDSSNHHYTLTPSAEGYSFDKGVKGQALYLNGNGQYLDFDHTGVINTQTTQSTFCVWVYSDDTDAPGVGYESNDEVYFRDHIILAQKDNAGTGRLYLYTRAETPIAGGDTRYFYDNFIGAGHNHSSYGSLAPGEWQHVAVVCNPVDQSITFYVNGERDCTVSASSFEACTGGFRMGGHKANKDWFEGLIDEAYFFKGVLSADEIRQVMAGTLDLTAFEDDEDPDDPVDPTPTDDWELDGKYYTIKNFSSNAPAYMQDTDDEFNYILCGSEVDDNSYWTFEKTDNKHCYYVKNAITNRYIQGYTAVTENPVLLGDEGAEYYVAAPSSEGGRYGFSYTGNSPFDFSSGTIGLNLRGESNQEVCWAQTYAAANGTNHRSFWYLNEVDPNELGLAIIPMALTDEKAIYDLQGRRLYSITQPGLYIVGSQKVVR